MKRLYFGFSLLLLTSCGTRFHSYWIVRELVLSQVPVVDLTTADIIESSFSRDDEREAMLEELTI
jgi:hypothetical protein